MGNAVRVGIISLGGAGRAHLRRFVANPKAKVVAVFDPKESVLQEVRAELPTASVQLATTDLAELLSLRGLDAVSICSPDHCHAQHALAALELGLHVLLEKPMATSFSDCQDIIRAAESSGKKVSVHHQMRYVPVFRRAKELVSKNRIGDVFSLESDYYHDSRRRAVLFDNWRMNPDTRQNIVFGGACHPIDLMQWLVADEIVEVFAYANHLAFEAWPDVDTVVGLLKFRSGIIGKVTKSVGCRRNIYHPLVVLGKDGTIVNGLLLGEGGAKGMIHMPPARRVWQRLVGRFLANRRSLVNYPFEHNEHEVACCELMDDFLDSILEDGPVPVSLEESASAIAVCEAVVKSYQSGQAVAVSRSKQAV